MQTQWTFDMRTDSAVAAYSISPEDHWTFLAGLAVGEQDYDILYKRQKKQESEGGGDTAKGAKAWGNIFKRFDEGTAKL